MATKFFFCKHCGNVVVKFVDSGVTPVCCGETMQELVPSAVEGLGEKHLPIIEKINDCTVCVKVGSIPHPMEQSHHISFIFLETEHGGQLRMLETGSPAQAEFCGCKDKITAVYEYCNMHGLWCRDIRGKFDDLKCSCDDKKDACDTKPSKRCGCRISRCRKK